MKIIRGSSIPFVPVAHENPRDPGALKKILVRREDLSPGSVQMVNWAKVPAGKGFQAHYQENMDEIFIVIKGSARVRVGGRGYTIKAGDTVIIPAGAVHEMKSLGSTSVLYLVIGITRGEGGKTILV